MPSFCPLTPQVLPLLRAVCLLAAVSLLSACSTTHPIRVGSTLPAELPAAAGPCLEDGVGCRTAANTALRLGDVRLGGQLLVLDAASRGDDAVAAGRAGLWLAPGAYAPKSLYGPLQKSGPMPGLERANEPRALVFGDVAAEMASTSIELTLPVKDRGLYASWLAAGSGHQVAAWREGDAVLVAPGAPLLNLLASGPLAVTNGWASAQLLARADRAADAGRASDAWVLVGQAVDALPEGTPAAQVGALHFVRYQLADAADAGADESFEALEEVCRDDEGDDCAFLYGATMLHHHRGWDRSSMPLEWQAEDSRKAWIADARKLAERLGGDRGRLYATLVSELELGTSRPDGICDTGHGQRVLEAFAPHLEVVRELGRDDLLVMDYARPFTRGETVRAADVERVIAWSQAPERRWIRTVVLERSLVPAGLLARRDDAQHRVAPLCTAYFAAVRQDMENDTMDGAVDRSLDRLLKLVTSTAGCPDRSPAAGLTDYVLERALAADEGSSAVLVLVGQAGFDLVITALTGGSVPDVMASAVMLRDGLVKVDGSLGKTPADENLRAVIGVAVGLVDTLTGRPVDVGQVLRDAVTALDPGDVDPETLVDAPAIVRYEPGLHLGALALLGLSHFLQGDVASLNKVVGVLEKTYARDLRLLLEAIDAAEHADPTVRLAGAFVAVGAGFSADEPDIDGLYKTVEAAAAPGPDEKGGWAVGLGLARALAWDLAALVANPDKERLAQSMAHAGKALTYVADRAIEDFALEGTAWEMLHTLPALHRSVVGLIADEPDNADAFAKAAPEIQTALEEALGKLPAAIRSAGPDELGIMAVVIDGMETVTEVGVANLGDDDALARVGVGMAKRSSAWPARYRSLGDGIAGTLLLAGGGDAALARKTFDTAADAAVEHGGKEATWLPRLLEARALAIAGDADAADEVAVTLLGMADEALACDVVHPGQSLLLYRALNHERAGRHAEADAAIARYLAFVEKQAYAGDGLIRCYAASNRRHFTLNADVSQRIGQMFLPTASDGTFQVGAGLKSSVAEGDTFECAVTPLPAARVDLVLNAQLMRAAYALRAGDDKTAAIALHGAALAGKLIFFGQPGPVDPAVAAGLPDARSEKVPLNLVMWVSQMARGRGHLGAAWFLDEFVTALAQQRGLVPAAIGAEKEVPEQLAEMGLDGMGPVVAAWWSQSDDATLLAAVEAAPVPKWSGPVYVVRRHQLRGDKPAAAAAAKKMKRPKKDEVGAATVDRLNLVVAAESGQIPAPVAGQAVAERLVRAGLPGEAADFVRTEASLIAKTDGSKVMPWIELGLEVLPPEGGASFAMAELMLGGLPAMEAAGRLDVWARTMAVVLPQLTGRLPLKTEYEALRIALQILPNVEGGPAQMAPLSTVYVAILRSQAGPDSPETISWSVVDAAAHAVIGEVDADRVDSLLHRVKRHPELDPRFRKFLEQLVATAGDGDKAKALGTAFILDLTR